MTVPAGVLVDDRDWTGRWVVDRLGAAVDTTGAPLGITVPDLVGLALRRNPRRPHLLVSRVLGKHVPADPRLVHGAGLLLGALVRAVLADGTGAPADAGAQLRVALAGGPGRRPATAGLLDAIRRDLGAPAPPAVVLGYAETATALGHAVADACEAACLHSTRRPVPGFDPVGDFAEEHSHATRHLLLPAEPGLLLNDLPLVLVDDELSTGRTVLNTIACLHRLHPRARYVIATLVDVRSAADRRRLAEAAAALATTVDVVALTAGRVSLPPDAPSRGQRLVAGLRQPPAARTSGSHRAARTSPDARRGRARRVDLGWPAGLPETGRHGFRPDDRRRLDGCLPALVDRLVAALPPDARRVHVLGVEELMYVPLRIAVALADRLAGPAVDVRFSTTTRSPVQPVDHPDYAVRRLLSFAAPDGSRADADEDAADDGVRYAYNLDGSADTVVLLADPASDSAALAGPGGLLDALTGTAARVLVATVGHPR